MTANRLKLPSYYLVESWGKQQVIKWLKSFQLDDCIPAFESREIDGPALLELTEEKLFTFQDIKIKRRVQLTKCVNECKSQAMEAKEQLTKCVNECKSQAMQAKEFVNSMRKPPQHKIKPINVQGTINDQENDFDCWDDFDDDDEEEEEHELQLNSEVPGKSSSPILNNNSGRPEPSVQNSEVCHSPLLSSEVNSGSEQYADNMQPNNSLPAETSDSTLQKKTQSATTAINKTTEKPSLPKPPSTLPSVKNYQRVHIPRSVPLRRPPSQPPPPPVPQFQHPISIQEDYEIPINSSLVVTPVVSSVSQPPLPPSSNVNKTPSPHLPVEGETQEMYEIVHPPEENYEVVSDVSTFASNSPIPVQPTVPPRVSGSQDTDPPPLPEKPRKLQEVSSMLLSSSKKDCSASTDKQHMQKKMCDETVSSSSNAATVLSGLLSSFRESKQGSAVSSKSLEQCNSDSLTSASQLPKVSTLEKNVSVVSPSSSLHSSKEKLTLGDASSICTGYPVLPVTPADDGNVLNRPLPPVPSDCTRNIPLSEQLWFHDISRKDAEEIVLRLSKDGAYVVRPSKRAGQENPYTLTILQDGKIFHLNIRLRPDGMYSLGREKPREKTFASVVDLILFHQKEPILLTSKGEPAGRATLSITAEK